MEHNMGGGKVVKRSQAGSSGWSSAYVYTLESGRRLFVKQGRDEKMFHGEALGLKAMYGIDLSIESPIPVHSSPTIACVLYSASWCLCCLRL